MKKLKLILLMEIRQFKLSQKLQQEKEIKAGEDDEDFSSKITTSIMPNDLFSKKIKEFLSNINKFFTKINHKTASIETTK